MPRRMKLLMSGMGAVLAVLSVMTGLLWSQLQALDRRTVLDEAYVNCYNKELFQTAECQLSGVDYGSPWYEGGQDLALEFTLRPVQQFKGWSVLGYTAEIQGRAAPWWLEAGGQPCRAAKFLVHPAFSIMNTGSYFSNLGSGRARAMDPNCGR